VAKKNNSYKNYEDFLSDISDYFLLLDKSMYLRSLSQREINKARQSLLETFGERIKQVEDAAELADKEFQKAQIQLKKIMPKMRANKNLPSCRLMKDFNLSEIDMLIVLYLSWQEIMSEEVYTYSRTIMQILKTLLGSDREALANLKFFGAESNLMKSGIIHLDRNNGLSAIGSSDIVIVDPVREMLINMLDYDLAKIKKRKNKSNMKTKKSSHKINSFIVEGSVNLILPEETMRQLDMVKSYVDNRQKIMNDWGLEKTITYGSAMTLLFYGPPGTGKTLSARHVASKTGKELMIAEYADMIDKFIGETEKHIRRVFREASERDAILLIDEVDSILSERKESSRSWEMSHVNSMLQAVESFDGVVIFTTNREDLIDRAMERRILIKIKFPKPNVASREMIWAAMFPNKDMLDDNVDFSQLARRYDLTGGQIKNAVLFAAIKATESGHTKIKQEELSEAAEAELRKTKNKARLGFYREVEDYI